jgi:subtilisin family serine protease
MKHHKLSPGLLTAYEEFRERGESGIRPRVRSLGILPSEGRPRPTRTVVFLQCDERADFKSLAQEDIRVNQPRGKMRTAYLPLEKLDALSENSAVQRIISSRYLRPLMDVARQKVHIPNFRTTSGLSGNGVIVGIVDTGIDPTHPAFAGRILKIWDQFGSGIGVPEGGYGTEFTGAAMASSRDTYGHGTHVAGIAAGSDATYTGVAPGAQYVIVRSDLMDAHIADGIRYIFRVAKDLDRPAVINLSLGGHADPHDGTDPLSQIIDSESGAGRIVCCAAGNEGNDNIHAQATLSSDTMHTMRFRVPSNGAMNAWVNGWYGGASSLEVSIRTPKGYITPWQSIITSGSPAKTYQLPDARITLVTPGPDAANGDHAILVDLEGVPSGSSVTGGVWQLRVKKTSGPATDFHAWALDNAEHGPVVFFTGTSVKDSVKIGSPGASTSAITVASYTTKVKWTDIDGNPEAVGLAVDSISEFSSEGPMRNGAQKPDFTAPGAMIVSCLSSASVTERADMVNQNFVLMAGTSMATPFLAGLIALLLERDPKLDAPQVKGLLKSHCSIPSKPAGTFHPKWGFGLVDAVGL